jgi:hypothetical protein
VVGLTKWLVGGWVDKVVGGNAWFIGCVRLCIYKEMECVVGNDCLYLGTAVTHHVCA